MSVTGKGYTAASSLGKSAWNLSLNGITMSRLIVLLVLALLVFGGLYYLSTVPVAQPTTTIETDVTQGGNAT